MVVVILASFTEKLQYLLNDVNFSSTEGNKYLQLTSYVITAYSVSKATFDSNIVCLWNE